MPVNYGPGGFVWVAGEATVAAVCYGVNRANIDDSVPIGIYSDQPFSVVK